MATNRLRERHLDERRPDQTRRGGRAPGATAGIEDATLVAIGADGIEGAIEAGGAWLGEATLQLAGGRVVPISLMAIAHRDGEGRVERYSAVMRDIQREVAAREELRRQTAGI